MKLDNKKLSVITVAVITVIAVISLFVLRVGVADNGNLRYVLEDIGIYDHQGASGSGCYADGFGVASKSVGTGTGDRSERIRTYNFPQGRVTDHRIGLTLHKLDAVLDGDLDEVIDALVTEDQAQRLKSQEGK